LAIRETDESIETLEDATGHADRAALGPEAVLAALAAARVDTRLTADDHNDMDPLGSARR
jgi:uncharacterized protein YsxB (DUF464 family)